MEWIDKVIAFIISVCVSVVSAIAGLLPDSFAYDTQAGSPSPVSSQQEALSEKNTDTVPNYVLSMNDGTSEERLSKALLEGIQSHESSITVELPEILPQEANAAEEWIINLLSELFSAIRKEHPELFWIGTSYEVAWSTQQPSALTTLTITFSYSYTSDEVQTLQAKLEQIVSDISADTPGDTYNAVKYFHDWIVNNTVYAAKYANSPESLEQHPDIFNITGVFLHGSAVCEGYAKAFQLLCDRAGIPCRTVFGTANGENHGWNYVKLDGSWYLVDCTWDDPTGAGDILRWDYFLKGSKGVVDDQTISSIYTPDNTSYPTLSSSDYTSPQADVTSIAEQPPSSTRKRIIIEYQEPVRDRTERRARIAG